ncbi:MAG: type II toxin-antitoxin system HigB family toxin [Saprospiraceae bacterium]
MRIITQKKLEAFCESYPDAAISLKFWHDVVKQSTFASPQEVIAVFNTADFVGNNRIVFNIAQNKYRLVVKFEFHSKAQLAFVRFIGTHKEYDAIEDIKNI